MRNFFFIICFVLTAAVCGFPAEAKSPVDTVRILAIGNSFSDDAIVQNLFDLAKADGIPLVIGNAYIAGCSIERHVRNSRSGKAEYTYRKIGGDGIRADRKSVNLPDIIADEQWDYVSFQQASSLSGMYETYEGWLPELYSYVKARVPSHTEFLMHQTWAYAADSDHPGFRNYGNDQMRMYESIVESYEKAAHLVGIETIVPSGTAVQNARTSFIGDRMTRDGYHLNRLWGRYTAACAWYEKLFGGVLGNGYAPEGLGDDYRKVAQLSAKKAVRHPEKVTSIKVKAVSVK